MRGYFGIGIEGSKTPVNVGTLWRSAVNFGASFIFTVGHRYNQQACDTIKAERQVPLWRFDDLDDLLDHLPSNCPLIGVENAEDSRPLPGFFHPERACYILGAEDRGLGQATMEAATATVIIPSTRCLNVAVAGSIVLYDRLAKL